MKMIASEPRGGPVAKQPTGVAGLDDITHGGLPRNRLTAIIGFPGAGKTVLALQTAINRISAADEACIFVAFEESVERILDNAAGFDWDPALLRGPKLRFVDAKVTVDAVVSGAFDLSGLLAALSALSQDIGAATVIFDGLDMLLNVMEDERLERRELSRLAEWIGGSDLSAIITVKAFDGGGRDQRRSDFLQYMTDCVIVLEGAVTQTEASRTLRVAKYRGSDFAANPVPLVIDSTGFEVVAISGARSDYPLFQERVSSGVPRLDGLINGGYLRGSSVLVSGSPGTSKTSLAASFVAAACARGEKALFVSFDEGGSQVVGNMRSIGLDLQPFVEAGQLRFEPLLSGGRSPEDHFVRIRKVMEQFRPACLVVDPLSALTKSHFPFAELICTTLLDHAKSLGVTVLCTSLLDVADGAAEASVSQVSTIADTWIHVSNVAHGGERNRALTIIKSRGTAHSNQVRELVLGGAGIDLVDAYVGEGEVLMGSARAQKEAELEARDRLREIEEQSSRLAIEREISELGQKVQVATAALEAKKREALFVGLAEMERSAARQAAAHHRLDLRRPSDEPEVAVQRAGH